ncbi:SurA N-terminal domain-containing protein [Marinobacterium weihaiense]|uniref:SurA N-terminal domain-containing protein n=1 Tax=Marinobacterium weihaiense TaxID=2851016 RepID=A0ABS6M8H4_9GAMM|nr:SurA N-terminal domain-containing protein [Marinobacterium weihaiense]MBV0932186.1 SurA N-terminal domain-containing protein [Marinobacterium weihaiense]
MLQTIRENSQGIIAKVIVGLIIVTFALFGVESLIGLANSEKAPAEVNGEDVSNIDLQRELELERRQILSRMGEDADPAAIDEVALRRSVLDRLINEKVLLQSAQAQDLHISEQMLDQLIVSQEVFQGEDGRFDRNQFELMLRGQGLTPLMYRDVLRRALLTAQERGAYSLSAFATPAQAQQLAYLAEQTRDIDWVRFSLAEAEASIEIDQDTLSKRYEAEQNRFMTEPQVVLSYVEIEQADFINPDSVSEADLRSAYEQELVRFEADDMRRAAHILLDLDGRSETDVRAEAQQLRERILSGELSFADAAREYSDDLGSSSQGGDLGLNPRGMLVGPFEDTLFAMEEGQLSEPVRTEFGYHLIQLNEIQSSEPPSFEQREADLRRELAAADAEADYVAALERLADLSFSAADLQVPAEELGLEIKQTEAFGETGGNSELTSNPKVIRAAFSADLLNEGLNSSTIELSREKAVVVRVQESIPARQRSLDEVAEQLTSELRQEQAEAALQARLDALVEQLDAGEALETVAEGLNWNQADAVLRDSGEMPLAVNRAAFAMPRPQADKPSLEIVTLPGGDQAIVRLRAVNEPKEVGDPLVEQLQQTLATRQGELFYRAHVQALEAKAEIERN